MPDSSSNIWPLRRRRKLKKTSRAVIDISVVVPTYKRPDLMRRCLDALLAQDLAPDRYEIIVCDDGPDAATERLVAGYAANTVQRGPYIEYVAVTGTQGPAGARNRGWRRARAPIVAFTDDDTVPDPSWLREGWRAMKPGISAATGRIEVPLPPHPTDYEVDAAGLAAAEFATANCFVRKRLLEQVGGFDERYTSAWREDSDLQFAILKAGGIIVRADSALVVHPVRPARWGISISQQEKSQFDALLRRKYPVLYRERIRRSPPWLYYFILMSLAVAATGVLCGHAMIALGGFAGWLVLTGVFAARRLHRTSRTASHIGEMLWTSVVIPPLSVYWRLQGALKFGVRL
jgi:cellulose synthase/poly-beta-1,6-N-acetylglucosamine synthase-like glycosyltransferase